MVWPSGDFCWFWKRGVDLVDWGGRREARCGLWITRREKQRRKEKKEI